MLRLILLYSTTYIPTLLLKEAGIGERLTALSSVVSPHVVPTAELGFGSQVRKSHLGPLESP